MTALARPLFAASFPVPLLSLEPFPRRPRDLLMKNRWRITQADLIASRWAARNPNYLNGGK